MLKGSIQKGDRVRININATLCDFTALDVVPREIDLLEDTTFFTAQINCPQP